jgi:hypothetical protein
VEPTLRAIPEQNDLRIRAITAALAAWHSSFTFLQKLGIGRPPLPVP